MLTHDPRVYSKALTAEDDAKEKEHEGASPRGPRKHNIRLLQALTPRDVKILVQAEEELSQTKVFCLPDEVETSFARFLIIPHCSYLKEYGRPTRRMSTSSISSLFLIPKN